MTRKSFIGLSRVWPAREEILALRREARTTSG